MVKITKIKTDKIQKYETKIWKKFWNKKGYKDPFKSQYYEVKEKNKRIGYFNVIYDCYVAYISSIILSEDSRGKGFGHKIMEFIEKEAIKRKCHKMRLETQKDLLPDAYHLYTKFGFIEEGILKNDYHNKDWVVLSKFIHLDDKKNSKSEDYKLK